MSIRKFSVIMALIACFPGSHLPLAAIADNVAVGSTDQTKIIPTIQIIQPKEALNLKKISWSVWKPFVLTLSATLRTKGLVEAWAVSTPPPIW
jgi:hypothetical protein